MLVPAGIYLSGSIHLQSNIHLSIDAGATVLGASQSLNAYDETEPCMDVNGLEIDNFKAQLAEGADASTFENVSRRVIRNSPVLER